MKIFLYLGTLITGAIVSGHLATAGDLEKPVIYVPQAPAAAPFMTWTGCYLGGNVGGASARSQIAQPDGSSASSTVNGIAGGGQVGCDYEAGSLVFGIEGMFDESAIAGNTKAGAVTYFANPFLTTATGRIGYRMQPAILAYAKFGGAWTHGVGAGWTGGGGFEWKFLPNWSILVEYNFLDFGSKDMAPTLANPLPASVKANVQTLLFGINYRFDFFSGATTRY